MFFLYYFAAENSTDFLYIDHSLHYYKAIQSSNMEEQPNVTGIIIAVIACGQIFSKG